MNDEIKIILIEDEDIWVHALSHDLNQLGYTVSGTAGNLEDALHLLEKSSYDLVLLDINLKDGNSGIELGSKISTIYKKPFIYLSATVDKAAMQQAIKTRPSAYLLKPVSSASLMVAIQTAIENFTHNSFSPSPEPAGFDQTYFFVKQGNKYKKLDWNDIAFMKSDKNYTMLYCNVNKKEFFIRSTLTRTLKFILPQKLQPKFVQVNRAEAVQVSTILEFKGEEVKTNSGTFTVTEGYYADIKKAIQILT